MALLSKRESTKKIAIESKIFGFFAVLTYFNLIFVVMSLTKDNLPQIIALCKKHPEERG